MVAVILVINLVEVGKVRRNACLHFVILSGLVYYTEQRFIRVIWYIAIDIGFFIAIDRCKKSINGKGSFFILWDFFGL